MTIVNQPLLFILRKSEVAVGLTASTFPNQKPRLGPKGPGRRGRGFATVRLDCREIRMKRSTASSLVALMRI